jgi:hypothetical protein
MKSKLRTKRFGDLGFVYFDEIRDLKTKIIKVKAIESDGER